MDEATATTTTTTATKTRVTATVDQEESRHQHHHQNDKMVKDLQKYYHQHQKALTRSESQIVEYRNDSDMHPRLYDMPQDTDKDHTNNTHNNNNNNNLPIPQINLDGLQAHQSKAWHSHHQATLNLVQRIQDHRQQQQLEREKALAEQKAKKKQEDELADQQRAVEQQPPTHKGSSSASSSSSSGPLDSLWSSIRKNQLRQQLLVSNTAEWKKLERHAQDIQQSHLKELLQDSERCDELFAQHDGVYLDYSRQRVTLETMQLLLDLAKKQNLEQRIQDMVTGEKINFTEERSVLHTALRADKSQIGSIVLDDGTDAVEEVHQVLDQIRKFTNDVRSGEIRGYTGKRLRNIVSVGIGGSYLGPEFLHECLKTEPEGINAALGYNLRFLSNVDPVDVERTCADLDPEETLIVVVSKTFTTAETMLNARTMRQWLWDFMGNDQEVVRRHMVACASITAKEKVEDFGIDTDKYFFRFWDWVGGRYSVCSAAGAVPISLLYGFDLFEKFLRGAQSVDEHFTSAPLEKNIPVIMGLLGVWNMSFLKYKSRTTLPYAEALLKLPAHIQQLDMESNGKYVTKHGLEVDYPVGEIDFGEAGTNGQHSFYQLLHMGQTVPCDFIGFVESQHDFCVDGESLSSHDELMANFFAQPDALANGKTADEVRAEGVPEDQVAHRVFKGNRPSLSLLLPKLTAYACGQLLAIYEHRTAVQGFIWDINSFDQWGVELGKKLALEVKGHLLEGRRNGVEETPVEASNPATSRLLNYYLQNSRTACQENASKPQTGNPLTRVTRTTHKEHLYPPPLHHDLGGHCGKLS